MDKQHYPSKYYGGYYLLGKSMRFYALNTKTEGHLLFPKVPQFLSHFTLNSGLCHFILGDVYLDHSLRLAISTLTLWQVSGAQDHTIYMSIKMTV